MLRSYATRVGLVLQRLSRQGRLCRSRGVRTPPDASDSTEHNASYLVTNVSPNISPREGEGGWGRRSRRSSLWSQCSSLVQGLVTFHPVNAQDVLSKCGRSFTKEPIGPCTVLDERSSEAPPLPVNAAGPCERRRLPWGAPRGPLWPGGPRRASPPRAGRDRCLRFFGRFGHSGVALTG